MKAGFTDSEPLGVTVNTMPGNITESDEGTVNIEQFNAINASPYLLAQENHTNVVSPPGVNGSCVPVQSLCQTVCTRLTRWKPIHCVAQTLAPYSPMKLCRRTYFLTIPMRSSYRSNVASFLDTPMTPISLAIFEVYDSISIMRKTSFLTRVIHHLSIRQLEELSQWYHTSTRSRSRF